MNGTKLRIPAVLFLGISTLLTAPVLAQSAYRFDTGGHVALVSPGSDRAYLGVQLEEEVEHSEGGARVTQVVDDSPAEKAGLRKGDIIVGFDGNTIRGPVALTRRIHASEPGKTVSLTIFRDGKRSNLEVEVGERKSPWTVGEGATVFTAPSGRGVGLTHLFGCDEDDEDCSSSGAFTLGDCEGGDCGFGLLWSGRPVLGVELVEVTHELREHLGGSRDAGVLISKIVSGTPAERAGLQVGDLIVSVAGDSVKSTRDLRRALRDKRGKTFQVEVIRDRHSRSIEVTVDEPEDDRPTGPRAQVYAPRAPRVAAAPPFRVAPPSMPARPSSVAVRPAPPARPAVPLAPAEAPRPSTPFRVPRPVSAPQPPLPPPPSATPIAPAPPAPPAGIRSLVI